KEPVTDRALGERARHPHIQRACLILAVNSCTRLYTERSSLIRRAIFEVAWITVVWSRPPKCRPIFGSDESVSSRERYIATWRGYTMFCERLSPINSSFERLKRSATSSWIRSIETWAASPCGNQ